MSLWTKSLLPPSLFLLLITSPVLMPVSAEVVHPYDWVRVGAYVKYIDTESLMVKFPNDTRLLFDVRYSPVVTILEWMIIEKHGDAVRLNVTLFVNGKAYIITPEITSLSEAEHRNATYRKTLFFDVDIYTREASLDGQPVGKTFFWGEPYRTPGEEFVVSSPPSDLIVGNVTYVRTFTRLGKEVKVYGVQVIQLDPYAWASYIFDWYTGVQLQPTLLSPWEVPPEYIGQHQHYLQNGTVWNITRYAGEPVGTNLGLDGATSDSVTFDLSETNIDIGIETTPEPEPTGFGIWEYLPHAFIATFAGSAATFLIIRRRRKQHPTQKNKQNLTQLLKKQ